VKRLSGIQRIAVEILIIIGAGITCYFAIQPIGNKFAVDASFSKATSEEVFRRYLFESPGPPQIKQIQGIEGTLFGYSGAAYIRFQSTDDFVDEILETGHIEPFVEIPCNDFIEASSQYFVNDHPDKFAWWRPTEVIEPICYQAQGSQYDDAKYLLISNESEVVYFYRTPTCGLCPD
jgi:hypothetical protein